MYFNLANVLLWMQGGFLYAIISIIMEIPSFMHFYVPGEELSKKQAAQEGQIRKLRAQVC